MNLRRFTELVLLCTGFILVNNYTEALWIRIALVVITLLYTTLIYRKNEILNILIKKKNEKKEDTFSTTERFQIILTSFYKSLLTIVLFQTPFLVYSTVIQILSFVCGVALVIYEQRREYSQEYAYYVEQ